MSALFLKRLSQIAGMVLLLSLALWGSLTVANGIGMMDAQAATADVDFSESGTVDTPHRQICDCSGNVYTCEYFESQEVAQACFDYCQKVTDEDIHDLDRNRDGVACEDTQYGTPPPAPAEPAPEQPAVPEEEVPGANNLVFNGNFEFGFYTVYELGFEPPDVGHVPNNWNWFKNEKFGKYNIYNNEGFGLICADDANQKATAGKNSLTIHMQSTDQSDARLGVYQTVNVVPGREYLFSMDGVIEVQNDGTSPDRNHRVLLYFDQQGGTDWRAVPHEDWTDVRWLEQGLEFKRSGPDDPDIAAVEDYHQVITAESDKLTIYIMAWRRWANWRTGIYTFDCVSLVPLNEVNVSGLVPRLSEISVTTVDQALEAGAAVPSGSAPPAGEPAVVPAEAKESSAAPSAESAIIPPSGGVIESSGNALLIGAASIVLILGLVGAGIWNARRQK